MPTPPTSNARQRCEIASELLAYHVSMQCASSMAKSARLFWYGSVDSMSRYLAKERDSVHKLYLASYNSCLDGRVTLLVVDKSSTDPLSCQLRHLVSHYRCCRPGNEARPSWVSIPSLVCTCSSPLELQERMPLCIPFSSGLCFAWQVALTQAWCSFYMCVHMLHLQCVYVTTWQLLWSEIQTTL